MAIIIAPANQSSPIRRDCIGKCLYAYFFAVKRVYTPMSCMLSLNSQQFSSRLLFSFGFISFRVFKRRRFHFRNGEERHFEHDLEHKICTSDAEPGCGSTKRKAFLLIFLVFSFGKWSLSTNHYILSSSNMWFSFELTSYHMISLHPPGLLFSLAVFTGIPSVIMTKVWRTYAV